MTVPFVHTALGVRLGGIDHLIRQRLDAFIFRHIGGGPAPCLRQAGQDKDQLHVRAALPQAKHGLSGEAVEATGASGPVKPNASLVQIDDDLLQPSGDFRPFFWRYLPVSGEAAGMTFHSVPPIE